jgi:hypothetical protein
MRAFFGLLIGLVVGFGVATGFYGRGGNIVVLGQPVLPFAQSSSLLPSQTTGLANSSNPSTPAKSGTPPPANRTVSQVVREIPTVTTNPSPPTSTTNPSSPAPVTGPSGGAGSGPNVGTGSGVSGSNASGASGENSNSWFYIIWPN